MRLKRLRIENGYTQAFIADYLCIKQNTYSQYETGARQLPIDILLKLSQLYKLSTDYILENDDGYLHQI